MTYGNMIAISLYRVIGRIGMRTLHLGMMNEGSDMGGRTWDRVRDVSAKIRCPCGPGVGTVAQKTVSMFPDLNIIAL